MIVIDAHEGPGGAAIVADNAATDRDSRDSRLVSVFVVDGEGVFVSVHVFANPGEVT